MVLEDYTLKHVWGPQIQTPIKAPVAASTSRVSNPGSPLLGFSHPGATLTGCLVKGRESAGGKLPERFSQRQKRPDPGQALRPFLRSCLFSSRSHRDCSVRDPPSGIAKARGDRSALAQPGSHTIQTRGLNRSLIRLRDPIKDPTDM